VLMARVEKRGRSEEKTMRWDYVREVARAYSEFFFAYNDGPLLIVDASEIDFVGNPEDRAALLEVISHTRAGVNHWSRR